MSDIIEGDPYAPEADIHETQALRQREASASDEVRRALNTRREAYVRLFSNTATSADKDIVLADLKAFCRGNASAFDADERVHCLLTGRQEVYLRIQDNLTLTLDQLVEKYAQR